MPQRVMFWLISGVNGACAVMSAQARGRRSLGWGIIGLLLGPVGVALAYMLPVRRAAIELSHASDEIRRCPNCVVLVRGEATICRLCGEPLEPRGARSASQ